MKNENRAPGAASDDLLDGDHSQSMTVTEAVERSCAGALLTAAPHLTDGALQAVSDGQVSNLLCSAVIRNVRRLRAAGRQVDAVIIAANLDGELPDSLRRMPLSTLSELARSTPVPLLAVEYARTVAELANRRQIKAGAAELDRLADGGDQQMLRDVLDRAVLAVDALARPAVLA